MARNSAAVLDEPDLDQILSDYDDRYLECRDHQHAWKVLGKWRDEYGDWNRRLRCSRCTMGRQDRYSYGVVKHRYFPPDGYAIKGVSVDRETVRMEALDRTPTYKSEEDCLADAKPTRRKSSHGRQTASSGRVIDIRDRAQRPRKRAKATARR